MTIEKQYGEIVAVCDDCGAESSGFWNDEFHLLISHIKAYGWVIKKDGSDWLHFCHDCRMSYRSEDRQQQDDDLIDEGDRPGTIFDQIDLG